MDGARKKIHINKQKKLCNTRTQSMQRIILRRDLIQPEDLLPCMTKDKNIKRRFNERKTAIKPSTDYFSNALYPKTYHSTSRVYKLSILRLSPSPTNVNKDRIQPPGCQ